MKRFCLSLFFALSICAPSFAYEYHWDNLDKQNLKVEAGSYVIRAEGTFFNVKDTEQNKIYTMQQYTEYSKPENKFYYYLGQSQTCSLDNYLQYGRETCSPLTANPAVKFEAVVPDEAENYKWQLIILPVSRAGNIKHNPDYWISNYYREDLSDRIKKSFALQYKKLKKEKQAPKIKPPLDVFVEVSYIILPDGSLKEAQVSASSGNEFFNRLALDSVKAAGPFLVMPLSTDKNSLNCTFRYELRIPSIRKYEERFLHKIN